jgi:hypothetical protein
VDAKFIRDLEKQRHHPNTRTSERKRKVPIYAKGVDAEAEHDQQTVLYPFTVVGQLLNQYNPVDMSIESALAIREQVLQFGIVELLLKLLTRQIQPPIRRTASTGSGQTSQLDVTIKSTSSSSTNSHRSKYYSSTGFLSLLAMAT